MENSINNPFGPHPVSVSRENDMQDPYQLNAQNVQHQHSFDRLHLQGTVCHSGPTGSDFIVTDVLSHCMDAALKDADAMHLPLELTASPPLQLTSSQSDFTSIRSPPLYSESNSAIRKHLEAPMKDPSNIFPTFQTMPKLTQMQNQCLSNQEMNFMMPLDKLSTGVYGNNEQRSKDFNPPVTENNGVCPSREIGDKVTRRDHTIEEKSVSETLIMIATSGNLDEECHRDPFAALKAEEKPKVPGPNASAASVDDTINAIDAKDEVNLPILNHRRKNEIQLHPGSRQTKTCNTALPPRTRQLLPCTSTTNLHRPDLRPHMPQDTISQTPPQHLSSLTADTSAIYEPVPFSTDGFLDAANNNYAVLGGQDTSNSAGGKAGLDPIPRGINPDQDETKPGTVLVKVEPASEEYCFELSGQDYPVLGMNPHRATPISMIKGASTRFGDNTSQVRLRSIENAERGQEFLQPSQNSLRCSALHEEVEDEDGVLYPNHESPYLMPFKCNICGKDFAKVKELALHHVFHQPIPLKGWSGPDALTVCLKCDLGFRRMEDYLFHQAIHDAGALQLNESEVKKRRLSSCRIDPVGKEHQGETSRKGKRKEPPLKTVLSGRMKNISVAENVGEDILQESESSVDTVSRKVTLVEKLQNSSPMADMFGIPVASTMDSGSDACSEEHILQEDCSPDTSNGEIGIKQEPDFEESLPAESDDKSTCDETIAKADTPGERARPYKCDQCGKAFYRRNHLKDHGRVHTGERPFGCESCESKFCKKSHLVAHVSRIHKDARPYACTHCDKAFNDSSTLKNHVMIHTGEKPFSCDQCERCFRQKIALRLHKRTIHSPGPKLQCPHCTKTFSSEDTLLKHEKWHAAMLEFRCDECDVGFPSEMKLSVHEQRVHMGLKRHQCKECFKIMKTNSDLVRHMRIHTDERPFVCSECGKAFRVKSDLVKHKRVHSGERPFLCTWCGQTFTGSSHLITHQRIHTGEQPYECEYCQRKFNKRCNLNAHVRIHLGEPTRRKKPAAAGIDSRPKTESKPDKGTH